MLKIMILIASFLCIVPSICEALCLENCQKEASKISSWPDQNPYGETTSNSPYGRGSISTGDVKNSVFGDMNIRIGHERVDVRTDSNSNNNTIDASINSTIILGDMNQ